MKTTHKICAIAAIALSACSTAFAADAATESLYKAKCLMCHGPDGTGNTPAGKKFNARDFHAPEVMKEPDAVIQDSITKGKNKMPSFDKKLTDQQIKDLVSYVRELGKKKA